jgi:hypothetical protein
MSIFEHLRKRKKINTSEDQTTQTVERMHSHTDTRNQPGSFDPVGFTIPQLEITKLTKQGDTAS